MRNLIPVSKKNITLYHLSVENHDNEVFRPRSIESGYEGEDSYHRRICFSTTLSGAFRAISFFNDRMDLYVHIPQNIDDVISKGKLFKPSVKLVPDQKYTNEYWVRSPVRMKCIGKIRICLRRNQYNTWRPSTSITWLERYK